MLGLNFLVLLGIGLGGFPCEGVITSPPDNTEYTFLPGRAENITWRFDDIPSSLTSRSWSFDNNKDPAERLAILVFNDKKARIETITYDVDIVAPATLVLKNVNQSYDGIYSFSLVVTGDSFTRRVRIFIAKKSTVILNCHSPVSLNEGDNFTCLCKGEGGNPPPKVAWYKDGANVSLVGTKNQTLKLLNVGEADNGTYTCIATNYPMHENYTDEKSIAVIVYIKPNVTIGCNSSMAVNEGVNVTCNCECKGGNPPANCTWFKNGTLTGKIGRKENTLNRPNIKRTDGGNYTCVGESHSSAMAKKLTTITVYYVEVNFYFPNNDNVTITCTSNGPPLLAYTIYHNGTKVARNMSYTISTVNGTHPGLYNCTATNGLLGELSAVKFLDANMGKPTPSIASSTTTRTVRSSSTTPSGDGTPGSVSDNNTGLIVGLSLGGLALIVIVCFLVHYCCTGTWLCCCGESSCRCGESSCCCGESSCRCGKSSCCCGESSCRCGESSCCAALSCCCGDNERENDDKNPNGSRVIRNHYELEEDHGEDAGAYDTVKQSDDGEGSQDRKKPAGDSLPPVYASVNKENRQGNTLYASLDSEALRKPGSKKKQPETKNAPTEYASIDFMQTGKTPNADNA